MERESVVNTAANSEFGKKMIVCGRAAMWWNQQIKNKINSRQETYKKVVKTCEMSIVDYVKR